jgi:hypothetical protein
MDDHNFIADLDDPLFTPDQSFRVWLRSVPGFYEQYAGYVDVVACDEDEACAKAIRQLRRTSFPERSAAMWRVEKVEAA